MKTRHAPAVGGFDVFLLVCLDALLSESHVTRAAERLGIAQPAMSAALGRLRRLFHDPLLTRTNQGMIPTPRAIAIRPRIRDALDLIGGSLSDAGAFDPARDSLRLRIGASESVLLVLFPALLRVLGQAAAHARLDVAPTDASRLRQDLEEGRKDLVIAYVRKAAPGLRTALLYRQDLVVVAAPDHPALAEGLSLDAYTASAHACCAVGDSLSTIEQGIDAALTRLGRRREVAALVPSIAALPFIVARTRLIATIPRTIAARFTGPPGCQGTVLAAEPPLRLEPATIRMYWHERMHPVRAHAWLRERVREAARQVERPMRES